MEQLPIQQTGTSGSAPWVSLSIVCLAVLMMALDATIVNVALPSVRSDLGFDDGSLVWVIDGYLLPYGGLLLLCGRLGDYHGHRRIFLLGIVVFTAASLACASARSAAMLVGARVVQGSGAAAISAASLPLVMGQFAGSAERVRALAIYSCVTACGSSAGLLLGGTLTGTLGWRWIFLVNLPPGMLVYALGTGALRAQPEASSGSPHFDVAGALTITVSLLLAISSVLNAAKGIWRAVEVLVPLGGAAAALLLFIVIEPRAACPIVPLPLLKQRNFGVCALAGALWSAALSALFFVSVLNLQLNPANDPLRVGLTFLPITVSMAICSISLSARLITRFGTRGPLVSAAVCIAVGLAHLSSTPMQADPVTDLLLIGFGAGVSYSCLLAGALLGVEERSRGLASSLINCSTLMGAALGLALIATIAVARSNYLGRAGMSRDLALHGGYSLAYIVAAGFAVCAALAGWTMDECTRGDSTELPQ